MNRGWIILALIGLSPGTLGAQVCRARFQTGNAYLTTLSSSPIMGSKGHARDSWYAKGIALDLQARWEDSIRLIASASRVCRPATGSSALGKNDPRMEAQG